MKVGYLVSTSSSPTAEERGAWRFLRKQNDIQAQRLSFQAIKDIPSSLRSVDLLWWHFDSTVDLPSEALDSRVLASISDYLRRGGSLLLSLLASQYTVPLRLETVAPNVKVKGPWSEESWAQGYPDIRGFGTRGGHPIFEGFLGGLYTWSPKIGQGHSACYYENHLPARGRVVAVEKLYIRLNEKRRNVFEYAVGKGRVLAIGSHFYFEAAEHRYRMHLERFGINCLRYLAQKEVGRSHSKRGARRRIAKTYWSFEKRTVEESEHSSKPIVSISSRLLPTSNRLAVRRDLTAAVDRADEFFDLGGKRILLMGKERSGLLEAWCHPVRILRDLKLGMKVAGHDLIWAGSLSPLVTIKPDSLAREYQVHGASVEEITFADHNRPCGAIHYRSTTQCPVEIVVAARIDLRLMWPLSEETTGSLRYAWDDGLRAAYVSDAGNHLVSLLGCSVEPNSHLLGQLEEISEEQGELAGIPTEKVQVAVGFRFTLSPNQPECIIAFAGSSRGEREAMSAYRSIVAEPQGGINGQAVHFNVLEERSTQVIMPDQEFNESYRWALAATDRFFVETPGLGSSLMAGYGLSSSGWNGGQETSGRPGYAWYFGRDSVWTSLGVLAHGDFERVRHVLEFLGRHQDVDGKILHELTTSGHAHYDAADSTPLYLILMGHYLRASGDVGFVQKEFPLMLKALDFCFRTDTDGDHLIENTNVGHGWVEGGELFPVHTEQYLASCWAQALEQAAFVAKSIRKYKLARDWGSEALVVKRIIRRDFWNAQTRCFNFGKLSDGSYRIEKTTLPTPGIYFGAAGEEQADQCLSSYASTDFSTDWGVRTIASSDPMYSPTGYHYGSVWPLFTGWACLAEFMAGRPVQAFQHLCSNLGLFRHFGAGYAEEVLHGEQFQPAGVCPHQAWSETMVLQPILEGMLGLKPDGLSKMLTLQPYFPPQWSAAEVRNIRVGKQKVHLRMSRGNGETRFQFRSFGDCPINVRLKPYLPLGMTLHEISLGSRRSKRTKLIKKHSDAPVVDFKLIDLIEVSFRHSGGVAVLPPTPTLKRGQESSGLRIIEERWDERGYILEVEGKVGSSYSLFVFDPDISIQSALGAEMGSRSGEKLELSVTIDQEVGRRSYGRKKVRLLIS